MNITHLMTEEIIKIHDEIIRKSGGHMGVINYGNLDFTMSQVKTTNGLNKKVAVLLFGVCCPTSFFRWQQENRIYSCRDLIISQGEINISQIKKWLDKVVK